MMTYGSAEWQPWVKDEKLGVEHVKAAYVLFSSFRLTRPHDSWLSVMMQEFRLLTLPTYAV